MNTQDVVQNSTEQLEDLPVVDRLEKNLFLLNDVYRKHQEYIKTKYKISALEMEIIQLIILEGKQKMKDIGKHFNIKLSTLTSIIDKIETQKLVKRENSKEDRRVVYLEATNKGEKLYNEYGKHIQVISQLMKKSLSDEDLKGFLEGLKKMSNFIIPENN